MMIIVIEDVNKTGNYVHIYASNYLLELSIFNIQHSIQCTCSLNRTEIEIIRKRSGAVTERESSSYGIE